MTLNAMMTLSDLQRYPWNLYLINIVEDNVGLLGVKMLNSDHSFMFSCNKIPQENFCLEIKTLNIDI